MKSTANILVLSVVVITIVLSGCSSNANIPLATETPIPTLTPTYTPEPTNTSTVTPTSTNTPVPPTPTVSPPLILLDYLDGVAVTQVDTFESSSGWDLFAGNISNGSLEIIGNDWNGLAKQGLFSEKEGILINFNYEQGSEFELMFDYGEWWTDPYRRFGVYFSSGYPRANLWLGKNGLGFNSLQGNFQPKADTWYTLLMAVDSEGEFLALIWDPTDASRMFSYHEKAGEKWAGYKWDFRIGANVGKIVFDDFMKITFDRIK